MSTANDSFTGSSGRRRDAFSGIARGGAFCRQNGRSTLAACRTCAARVYYSLAVRRRSDGMQGAVAGGVVH